VRSPIEGHHREASGGYGFRILDMWGLIYKLTPVNFIRHFEIEKGAGIRSYMWKGKIRPKRDVGEMGTKSETDLLRLIDSFEFVRKEFFPRWDNKKEWLIKKLTVKDRKELGIKGPCMGRCEREIKTILIQALKLFLLPHGENSLHWLLIHEICHAVSSDSHGRRWKNRMLRMSELAQKKGDLPLSKMILLDLEKIKKVGELDRFGIWRIGEGKK
jgi:hypothetical protein